MKSSSRPLPNSRLTTKARRTICGSSRPAAAGLAAVCRRCRWVMASGSAVSQKRLLGIGGARAAAGEVVAKVSRYMMWPNRAAVSIVN